MTFVLGRAGAGKTHHCLEGVCAELAQPDGPRLVLLVPEQASLQTERALARRAPRGAYTRAEVLSFSRLARRVLSGGGEPETVDARGREMALRGLLARDATLAPRVRGAARSAGFVAALSDAIGALLLDNVSPSELLAAADGVASPSARDKLLQLARIFDAYLAWLGERTDAAARLGIVRRRIAESGFLRDARVWVDGFAGFTGQEVETLVAISAEARSLEITLLADPRIVVPPDPDAIDPLRLFSRTEESLGRLWRRFEQAGATLLPPLRLAPPVAPRFRACEALALLERRLVDCDAGERSSAQIVAIPSTGARAAGGEHASAPRRQGAGDGGLRLLRCPTHADELRAAARWIRGRVQEGRGALRWSDFALIARDLEPFAGRVAEVFAEFEIPVFIDRRRPLHAHPLGRLMRAAFAAVTEDAAPQAMLRLMRTGLLPMRESERERIESALLEHEVRGWRMWRAPAWAFAAERADQPAAKARRALVAGLEGVIGAAAAPSLPGAAWARVIYGMLRRLRVGPRVAAWIREAQREKSWESAETHRLAWEAVIAALDDLHGVLGDAPLSAAEAAQVVGGAIGEATIGLAPPTLDQVLVSAIERSRHPEIRHAWIFGFNDGVFPRHAPEDPLLTLEERLAIAERGIAALAPRRDDVFAERMLAYIAITRPSHSVTVSFAERDAEGGPLAPSPLLGRLRAASPDTPIEEEPDDGPATLSEFARGYLAVRSSPAGSAVGSSGGESARTAARQARRFECLREVLERDPDVRAAAARMLRGLNYSNEALPLPVLAGRSAAGAVSTETPWVAAVSHVETYLRCPFRFFAERVLRVRGPVAPRPPAALLGEAAHAVMSHVTRAAMSSAAGARGATDDQWRNWTDAALQAARAELAERVAHRPRMAFLLSRLDDLLPSVVRAHALRWRHGLFSPALAEAAFGPALEGQEPPALPPVRVPLAGGAAAQILGRMDRADVAEADGRRFRIAYDYKPRARSIGRRRTALGEWLQLLTYGLALRAGHPGDEVGGLLIAPLTPDLGSAAGITDETHAAMRPWRPRGVIDVRAAELLDPKLGNEESPVAALRLTKGGELAKVSDGRPAHILSAWLTIAGETLRVAAEGVVRGATDVAPLVEGRTLACVYCDLASLCRMDRAYNRPRAAEAVLPVLEAPAEDGDDAAD
ncbi:MAG: PD-(D/E)XK nuclease family protein [Phycisphaerales bacterium]|nr:PD-(D/E)XK nuclease family protein [Phycisphaerales bacterium]